MSALTGKQIVLGITGGIAAYKGAELCRSLVKAGATVRVVMTEAATRFIAPLTMQALSGSVVARDLFDADQEAHIGHIRLGDEADLILVAPATADAISRFAAGAADDLLAAVILASRAPVLLAPAMNVNMWQNPFTQANLGRLVATPRFRTVGPDAGELACGWVGEGRLIEPAEIVAAAERLLTPQELHGRRIVVAAGPTFEPLDDVRFLGNRSSGKMGFALARSAAMRGASVTLIAGPVALTTPLGGGIFRQDVETAAEMRTALETATRGADAVIMAAAVADFRPAIRVEGKLSRRANGAATPPGARPAAGGGLGLALLANPDLLAELGRRRAGDRPLLVGFAAEVTPDPGELVARARKKLSEKHCDVIIANHVGSSGGAFGSDDNAVILIFSDGGTESLARAPKTEIAEAIWQRLVPRLAATMASEPRAEVEVRRRRTVVVRPPLARAAGTTGATGRRSRRG